MNRYPISLICLFAIVIVPLDAVGLDWSGTTLEGLPCEGGGQGFGPWDFFDVDEPTDELYQPGRWWEVKRIHADPGLAAMRTVPFDAHSYDRAANEFDYVLRAYPNHPQILYAVIELEFKRKASRARLRAWQTPPECYLQRAMMFRPRQSHIFQLMALYLQKLGKTSAAIEQYELALGLNSESAEIHYNLGLAYFEAGNLDVALSHAHRAYELGFPLPGLRRKLVNAGRWGDPDKSENEAPER